MLRAAVLATAVFILAGCSDSPAPVAKTEAPKKPEVPSGPITALTAYNAVYKVARQIAPDLQTASITGNNLADAQQSGEGKYTGMDYRFCLGEQAAGHHVRLHHYPARPTPEGHEQYGQPNVGRTHTGQTPLR